MHFLNNAVVYLAGPIDKVADHGIGWRREFIDKAKQRLSLSIIDPTDKPGTIGSETLVEKTHIEELKAKREWTQLTRFVKRFRRQDLRFVDLSDFIVVYIDPAVHMVGSWDEVFTAEDQQKPIFAICKGGREAMSAWTFSVISWEDMFDSIDDLILRLEDIDSGDEPMDDRWLLIRQHI